MADKRLFPLILFLVAAAVFAAQPLDKPQTHCPVTGMPIHAATSPHIDYQGQRIYFCSDKCPAAFKADPEKYFGEIEKAGVVLESVQKECPVTGEDIDKAAFVDYKGRRVYFCCTKCPAKFEKDPAKYLARLPGEQAPVAEAPKS